MSPFNILKYAREKELDIIGITDHNSTRQCLTVMKMARENDVLVLPGCEVNTREEVHCVALFETIELADEFQDYLDMHLPDIKNNPEYFGFQVVVNEEEHIIYEEEKLLIAGLKVSIEDVEKKVHQLGGIFYPAHIDRKANGIYAQLGVLPVHLKMDALELSYQADDQKMMHEHPEIKNYCIIRSSDAHYPEDIGRANSEFDLPERSFKALKEMFLKCG
jgi:hypothetical protein